MRAWNLLHYPALAQRRRQRHRLRTSSAGCLLGLVLSWVGVQWMDRELLRLQAEQADWQARLNEARQVALEGRAQERQQQAWDRQWQPLRQVLFEQDTWAAWLQALQQEAPRGSWQLLRLQQEPGRIELQGLSPDVRSLGLARERVSAQLRWDLPTGPAPNPGLASAGHELNLHSVSLANAAALGARQPAAEAVEFVVQAPWPVAAASEAGVGKPLPRVGTGEGP